MSPITRTVVAGLCAVAALAAATPAPAQPPAAAQARRAIAPFHNLDTAKNAEYGLFTDAAGIACIDQPGEGGMGVHYVNGDLVGDGAVDLERPEALVYEPQENGRLRLVAVEYVVFREAWDAQHSKPPSLYGRDFEAVPAGNRYGLDPFYELHVWLWKDNPSGMFEDWNPRVSC